jgi:serine acetyltransferase
LLDILHTTLVIGRIVVLLRNTHTTAIVEGLNVFHQYSNLTNNICHVFFIALSSLSKIIHIAYSLQCSLEALLAAAKQKLISYTFNVIIAFGWSAHIGSLVLIHFGSRIIVDITPI